MVRGWLTRRGCARRRNIKRTEDALREQANKGLVANEQAVSNIRDCVRLLRETGPNLKRATDLVVMREVSVPLHQEAALAKTNALAEVCGCLYLSHTESLRLGLDPDRGRAVVRQCGV